MFVLDTDHITLLLRKQGPTGQHLRARLEEGGVKTLTTTIITDEEQTRGWLAYLARARSEDQMIAGYRHLNEHIDDYRTLQILNFESGAAALFFELKRSRIRVATMDLRIAAIVLSRDAILLSRNLGDFRKVPGLRVEDWCG